MINTVYIAMYTPENAAVECLGAYTTRKNAEDVLVKHHRELCKRIYTQALTHITQENYQGICKKELDYYNTISDYELFIEMEHNRYLTIVTAPIDEFIDIAVYYEYD